MVNDLAEQLRPVLLKINRELRRELHGLGITGGQASLLVAIKRAPGLGVNELAGRERVSPPAMTGAIRRLERAGLVRREPDPADRRRHGLYVSEEGERVLRAVKRRRTAWLAARLRELDEGERVAVERALTPLARLLEVGA
jgi:DNA-binding MarR family transcriptional regulator